MADQVLAPQRSRAADDFRDAVGRTLDRLADTQMDSILQAARLVADTVERGGVVYAFGSGHSQSIAIELYYRAGGLSCFDVIYDRTFGRAERLAGYAAALLDAYPMKPDDLLIVISNSGRNPLPVEMALEAKARGVAVIGITSLAHSLFVAPRNPAGARLCETCDVVIDNCGEPGDAAVELEDVDGARILVGATSTIAGAFIAQAIAAAAAEELVRRGMRPPVLLSANLDGADERNRKLLDVMRERLRGL